MVYLHKILPLIFSPFILYLALVFYGVIRKKTKVIAISTIVILFLSLPIVSGFLSARLEGDQLRKSPDKIQAADAIVVLSGMTQPVKTEYGIIREWTDPDRFFGGLELYKLGKAQKMVFAQGRFQWTQGPSESTLTIQTAIRMGVDSSRIITTAPVETTEEEAEAIAKMLGNQKQIILVTAAYHMPRATLIFEQLGFKVQQYPVDFKTWANPVTILDFVPSPGSLGNTEKFVREMLGRAYYWVKKIL